MKSAAALIATMATVASADHYAVLVAGSNTYGNYRHHADVAHAYHVALKGGIPADNIIVMMFDDVVNDDENPYPGQLFNQPTAAGTPGVDVYHGVKKDYTGKTVTAANFISIITGDKEKMKNIGTGRVLESTSEDRVFINFVDHGGVGLIAFPKQPYLYKKDLQSALLKMHNTSMYKELVFYLEACESGSMFQHFDMEGLNMYVTTAANGKESSWGTYCAPNDMVDGKTLNTCLGDLFSVNWMEDSDSHDTTKETLNVQYKRVKKLTNKSHVMQFGDVTDMGSEFVAEFIGNEDVNGTAFVAASFNSDHNVGQFDSRDHELDRFYHAYSRSDTVEDAERLMMEIHSRVQHRTNVERIVSDITNGDNVKTKHLLHPETYYEPKLDQCQKKVDAAYDEHCGGYTDYSLKFVRVMVNLCETTNGDADRIVQAVAKACQ